jgi:type VI secretion system protein ImpJ
MTFWTEIHWHEGMFLRPHHLQAAQRRMETVVRTSMDAARPYAWGFLSLEVAKEPLENFTLRLDRCDLRLKDGTWVRIPENTLVAPLNFQNSIDAARGTVELYLGVPEMQEVRANAVPLENPDAISGSPRYEPAPVARRDENTGQNPQTLYVRRMRARLFVAGEDMTGYECVRIGRLRRSDRPGALPEMDEFGVGPVLAVQADPGLSGAMTSLADQIEAKDEVLAREAKEHAMKFTDGVTANTEHLLKLHALNEVRAQFKAMLQGPLLHPFDAFVTLSRMVGRLSVFHDDLVPGALPGYDHDEPGAALAWLRRRIVVLLDALRPMNYVERPFARKRDERGRDGLEVELDRKWVDDELEMYVGLTSAEMDINEVERHIYSKYDMKLASPTRSPKIYTIATRGLKLQIKSVPPGTLPRRPALHYFRIDKTLGADRTDYWKECEQERGIRLSIREGQIAGVEVLQPKLFVILKER